MVHHPGEQWRKISRRQCRRSGKNLRANSWRSSSAEENDRITIEFQPIKEWPVKCLILARDFGKPKESIG